MKKFPIRIISTQQNDTLEIRFSPTDICNFNCTYCFIGSGHINKHRYPKDVELVIKNVRKLLDFYSTHHNKTRFVMMLTGGGEPTMWPKIEYFCSELKKAITCTLPLSPMRPALFGGGKKIMRASMMQF